MADAEKRLGWGEPYSLNPAEADAVRDIVANINPLMGDNLYPQWSILRAVLIPPVEACKSNRETIDRAAGWLQRLENPPGILDPGYEEFETEASGVLQDAIDAFESRPKGCEMEMNGDRDCFNCDRCNFANSTDTSF